MGAMLCRMIHGFRSAFCSSLMDDLYDGWWVVAFMVYVHKAVSKVALFRFKKVTSGKLTIFVLASNVIFKPLSLSVSAQHEDIFPLN